MAKVEGAHHAKLCVEEFGGVGIDRIKAGCFASVKGNQSGITAANDDN